MKLANVTGPVVAAFLVAACGANSRDASDPQRASAHAAQERAEARQARDEADKARLEAQKATEAQHEKERDAQLATQRAAQVELQASPDLARQPAPQTAPAPAPRAGTAELQGDTTGKVGVVRSTVLFAANSAELSRLAKTKLDETARVLHAQGQVHNVIIEGYSDDAGADSTNVQLSRKRAEAVAGYLRSKGIATERMSTKALGSGNPVSKEDTNRGQALNRRVAITIQPAAR
jgi:outer membrane protein OmpA-like peptidoglycan-associated protein